MFFFKFSTLVIKRRLTDYARHNKKHCHVYPFTYFEDKNNSYFEQIHLKSEIDLQNTYEISREIELYEQKLRDFGISLEHLAKCAPKHKDSKSLCIKIAKVIADNKELFSKLERTRNIPKTELLKLLKINKRQLREPYIHHSRCFDLWKRLQLTQGLSRHLRTRRWQHWTEHKIICHITRNHFETGKWQGNRIDWRLDFMELKLKPGMQRGQHVFSMNPTCIQPSHYEV